jgi:Flp pilus assembly protein TadG
MSRPISSRRGQGMLEFTLVAVPFLFVIISLWWMGFGMWEYHTLSEAVNYTARSASAHGAGCISQTCATTVGSTAQALATNAIGIPASQLNATFTSTASNTPITCNPLSTCTSNSAAWPTLTGNSVAAGATITIAVTYQFSSAISLWIPGVGSKLFNPVTLGAQAQAPIVF